MSKELLRAMLDNVINDRTDDASTGLHDYLRVKMQNMIGVTEAVEGQDVRVKLANTDRSGEPQDIDLRDIKHDLDAAGIKYKDLRSVERADGKREVRNDVARFVVLGGVSEEELADALPDFEVEFE